MESADLSESRRESEKGRSTFWLIRTTVFVFQSSINAKDSFLPNLHRSSNDELRSGVPRPDKRRKTYIKR